MKKGRFLLGAKRMVALYERHGAEIFEQSLWRKLRTVGGIFEEAYSHKALEAVLEHYFADRKLADCGVPAMVTSYDIEHRRTVFMKTCILIMQHCCVAMQRAPLRQLPPTSSQRTCIGRTRAAP